jgi:hypothetical protein
MGDDALISLVERSPSITESIVTRVEESQDDNDWHIKIAAKFHHDSYLSGNSYGIWLLSSLMCFALCIVIGRYYGRYLSDVKQHGLFRAKELISDRASVWSTDRDRRAYVNGRKMKNRTLGVERERFRQREQLAPTFGARLRNAYSW